MGCPEGKVAVPDAGMPELPDAAVAWVVDAGPPVPLGPGDLNVVAFVEYVDGGRESVTSELGDGIKAVDVEIADELIDYRVRLMDGNDQVLESDDQGASADGGIRYRLNLLTPLKPGRNFAINVDAQTSAELVDKNGARFRDFEMPFKTRGDYQPDPKTPGAPAKKKKSKKR